MLVTVSLVEGNAQLLYGFLVFGIIKMPFVVEFEHIVSRYYVHEMLIKYVYLRGYYLIC